MQGYLRRSRGVEDAAPYKVGRKSNFLVVGAGVLDGPNERSIVSYISKYQR